MGPFGIPMHTAVHREIKMQMLTTHPYDDIMNGITTHHNPEGLILPKPSSILNKRAGPKRRHVSFDVEAWIGGSQHEEFPFRAGVRAQESQLFPRE